MGPLLLLARSPVVYHDEQVGYIDDAVEVEISRRVNRTPVANNNKQIGNINNAISVEIGDLGRTGEI